MAIGQRVVNIGNFDGAPNAGSVMQFNPPRKNTYNALYLLCLNSAGEKLTGAQIEAEVGDIEIIVNGDQKIKLSAKFLRAIFKARTGYDCTDGFIPILFANDKYVTYQQKVLSSWGMADVTSFQIYANLLGTVTNLKNIVVYADISPIEQIMGLHQCYTYQTSGVIPLNGTLDCTTLSTFGADARIQSIYVSNPDTTNIDLVGEYLEANGVINLRQNITVPVSEIANLAFGNETPIATLGSAFRFDSGDDIRTTLAMANITQLRYRCEVVATASAAANQVLTFVYEYLRGYTTEKQDA